MNLSMVNIIINEAAVTAVNEFKSFKGYGVDFFVEASSSNGSVYFQIVVYDDAARSYSRYIHEGDHVKVTGFLKTKPYKKKNGCDGLSLIIERPNEFRKISGSNSELQLPQQPTENEPLSLEDIIEMESAVPASAVTADNTENEEHECFPPKKADTALQELQAETASQNTQSTANSKLEKFTIDGQTYEAYIDDSSPDENDLPF